VVQFELQESISIFPWPPKLSTASRQSADCAAIVTHFVTQPSSKINKGLVDDALTRLFVGRGDRI
jgi:hypothetical protein